MGSASAARTATFEELYQAIRALPEGLTGEILEPGVIRTMGRPGGPHRIGARAIWRALEDDDRWEGGRGWWFEQEAEIRLLRERLVVPDLAGWRLDSGAATPPPFVFENPITRPPAWCCEVLSRSTEKVDRDLKLPLFAEAGVEWVWIVDPETRKAEILRTAEHRIEVVETIEGDVKRALPPFASIVDTSRWWVTPPGPRLQDSEE
jgi:Uma2 family endonuclease